MTKKDTHTWFNNSLVNFFFICIRLSMYKRNVVVFFAHHEIRDSFSRRYFLYFFGCLRWLKFENSDNLGRRKETEMNVNGQRTFSRKKNRIFFSLFTFFLLLGSWHQLPTSRGKWMISLEGVHFVSICIKAATPFSILVSEKPDITFPVEGEMKRKAAQLLEKKNRNFNFKT